MASTFSEMKTALDEIAARISRNRARLTQAVSSTVSAETDLTQMATDYSTVVSDINTFLTNNSNDEAAKTLKAEKDLLVSEFQALKTASTNMKAAVQGVSY